MNAVVLPNWAVRAVAEMDERAGEFGAAAESYKKSSDPFEKSLFLGVAISRFNSLNEMFRRWKFIAKSTPMDEIEKWMEDKKINLLKRDLKLK